MRTCRISGGAPRAISAPGIAGALISPDQKWIAAGGPSGGVLIPVDGGQSVPIQGLQRGETVREWTTDGQLFVASAAQAVLRLDRLDPRTGRRTTFREAAAPAIVGIRVSPPFITPDGSAYTYGYSLSSSDMYVVGGLR